MFKNVLVLLGPNTNTISSINQGIYGKESAESINLQIESCAKKFGINCEIFQSNHEGELIDKIQQVNSKVDGVIINAGALANYSYSLRDAIEYTHIPFVEVHMSNIYNRENFRSNSVIAPVCAGQITGFGKRSYFLAMQAIKDII